MPPSIFVDVSCPLLWAQTSLTLKQRIVSFHATFLKPDEGRRRSVDYARSVYDGFRNVRSHQNQTSRGETFRQEPVMHDDERQTV